MAKYSKLGKGLWEVRNTRIILWLVPQEFFASLTNVSLVFSVLTKPNNEANSVTSSFTEFSHENLGVFQIWSLLGFFFFFREGAFACALVLFVLRGATGQ